MVEDAKGEPDAGTAPAAAVVVILGHSALQEVQADHKWVGQPVKKIFDVWLFGFFTYSLKKAT